jgi:hypothetical protein
MLSSLFEFLRKETFLPIGKPASVNTISLRTFTWFTDRFKICTEILSVPDVVTVYRTLTRMKPLIDHVPVGMEYGEFL